MVYVTNIFFSVQDVKNLQEYKELCSVLGSILGTIDEEHIGEDIEKALIELTQKKFDDVRERLVNILNGKYIVKNDADKEIKYDIIGWTNDNVYYFFYGNNFLRKDEFRLEISKELGLSVGSPEYQNFWKIIDLVGKIIEEYYKGTSFGEILEKRKSFPVIKRIEEGSVDKGKSNNGKKPTPVNQKGVSKSSKSLKKKNIPVLFLIAIVFLTLLFIVFIVILPSTKNTSKKDNRINGVLVPQESTSTTKEDTNTKIQQETQNIERIVGKENIEGTETTGKIDKVKETKLDGNTPLKEGTPVGLNNVQNESSKTNQEANKNQKNITQTDKSTFESTPAKNVSK